ncbi:unnamed protein product [Urochloa humidicola]
MASNKSVLPSAAILILRLLTLTLLAASLAVIAADKLTADDGSDPPQKFTFRDVHAYRYLLAVAVVGCAYTLLLQLPLAAAAVAWRNKQHGEDVAALLLALVADVAFAMLLAAGAAAGLGFTHDVKRYFDGVVFDGAGGGGSLPEVERLHRDVDRFFDMAYASAGLMVVAAACTAVIVVISVYSLVR